MRASIHRPALGLAALVSASVLLIAQAPPESLREGQQLLRQGKVEEALAVFKSEVQRSPDSAPANNAMGIALDLLGRGSEARKYFAKAIEAASTPQSRVGALRSMAMSYAFENDCANTVRYEQQAYDIYVAAKDYYQQGEMANEAARVCIETGDLDTAEKWYRIGFESGSKQPDMPPERVGLWSYRWEHAQARLAARRKKPEEAQKHVAAARALLDKNPEMAKTQEVFYPYLTGYVAFYNGDDKAAVEQLQKANQNDPFIQCLTAQAYEKLGEKAKARELYAKAAATTAHNPPAAFARPFARKKLGSA